MKIAIASDHAGFGYKTKLVNYLKTKGVEIKDFGPINEESRLPGLCSSCC